jgi:hypothetical protein
MSSLCPSVITCDNECQSYRRKLVYLPKTACKNLSILEVSPQSFQNFENGVLRIFVVRKITATPTDSLIYSMKFSKLHRFLVSDVSVTWNEGLGKE